MATTTPKSIVSTPVASFGSLPTHSQTAVAVAPARVMGVIGIPSEIAPPVVKLSKRAIGGLNLVGSGAGQIEVV